MRTEHTAPIHQLQPEIRIFLLQQQRTYKPPFFASRFQLYFLEFLDIGTPALQYSLQLSGATVLLEAPQFSAHDSAWVRDGSNQHLGQNQ